MQYPRGRVAFRHIAAKVLPIKERIKRATRSRNLCSLVEYVDGRVNGFDHSYATDFIYNFIFVRDNLVVNIFSTYMATFIVGIKVYICKFKPFCVGINELYYKLLILG